MPDPDLDADEQDLAETFDETHREDEDPALMDLDEAIDPDLDDSAYDVTRAEGDEDEDEEDDDENEDEDKEEDGAEFLADEPDNDASDDEDVAEEIVAAADEAELTLVADLDEATDPRDRDARHYESARPLSDEQIAALGYAPPGADPGQEDRLDEGLDETFPASDPVSVSHVD
jgi:hypothetical protein